MIYQKVPVCHLPLDELVGSLEPRTGRNEAFDHLHRSDIANKFTGIKRQVVLKLMDDYNFHQIAKELNLKNSQVYKIKRELRKDLSFVYNESHRKNYIEKNSDQLEILLLNIALQSKQLRLSQFQEIYVNDYDPEATSKGWVNVPLQDKYEQFWNNNQKTVLQAPREHLKTTSVISYLVKKIFEREYPIEINYFHLNKEIAIEKIRKMQMIIERNPVLAAQLQVDQVKNWKDGEIRLLDGTVVQAMGWLQGTVGKHPHIIVLDDVIDVSVAYSDTKNERAIRKFYSEVYPMITKMTEEKQIIVVGTAQREDDLYAKLPEDFARMTLQAVDEEKKTVLEPALFSFEELMKIKSDISKQFGEKYWLKEYMNIPFSAMGITIKPEWIRTYVHVNHAKQSIFQGWDLAPGKKVDEGDWTAGATIGVEELDDLLKIYVLDIFKDRIRFSERLKAIVASANKWKPLKIGVEDNVFQYDTVSTLQKQTNLNIIGVTSITNKIESFEVELAPHFENGKVYLRADMDDLKNELLSLPIGKHDDQADALKLAIKVSAIKSKEPKIRVLG